MRRYSYRQGGLVGKVITIQGGLDRLWTRLDFSGSTRLIMAAHACTCRQLGVRCTLGPLFALLCAVQIGVTVADAAQTFSVQLAGRPYPELLAINQGDTVTFLYAPFYSSVMTESYTGEWRSPLLGPGQSFSYTFTNPGTYVYWSGQPPSLNYPPGVIKVQAVTNGYPAVWITRPLDNFVVAGYTDIEVATTNSPGSVASVNFYADGQFIGSITNPPYVFTAVTNLGTYSFTASVVDTGGQTNFSAPIRITFAFEGPFAFGLGRLPEGQTVFFTGTVGGPYCIEWSQNLKTWNRRILGQQWGDAVIVDETTTNANIIQRFYKIVRCP